jgi:sarcosine oxidase subunit beta
VHGASTAYHLARRGAGRVLLLERRFLASGPTGRSTALVRRFYGIDFFTRTAGLAADIFQHWDARIGGGDSGFRQVGFMVLAGPEEAPHLAANVARARALGARVELIDPATVRTLAPGMETGDVAAASWEPESGYADPAGTTAALAAGARAHGAQVIQGVPVTAISVTGTRVTGVRTEAGDVSAPIVVNCAGLWADRLLRPLGIEVPVSPTRHQMCVFRRPPGFAGHPAVVDRPNATYFRPESGNLTLFGLGSHEYREIVDPDRHDEGVDASEREGNAQRFVRRFPSMEQGLVVGGYAGVYDTTPDYQPVLGPVAEYAGLAVDFGWSGHGFKHAVVIGDVLAEAVLTGRSGAFDLRPFRWTRFREGDLWPAGGPTAAPHPKLAAA